MNGGVRIYNAYNSIRRNNHHMTKEEDRVQGVKTKKAASRQTQMDI